MALESGILTLGLSNFPLEEMIRMAWGLVILCVILGSFAALRSSGRKKEIQRSRNEDE